MPNIPSFVPSLTSLPGLDAKPFYAYVGAGDAAIERFRTRVVELPATLKSAPVKIQEQVKSLPTQLTTLPAQAKELQAQLTKSRSEFGTKAEKLYDELAARGEKIVTDLRGGKTTKTVSKPAAAKKPAAKKAPVAKATTASTAAPTAAATTPAFEAPTTPAQSSNGTESSTLV
jgi:hypothetical protein